MENTTWQTGRGGEREREIEGRREGLRELLTNDYLHFVSGVHWQVDWASSEPLWSGKCIWQAMGVRGERQKAQKFSGIYFIDLIKHFSNLTASDNRSANNNHSQYQGRKGDEGEGGEKWKIISGNYCRFHLEHLAMREKQMENRLEKFSTWWNFTFSMTLLKINQS